MYEVVLAQTSASTSVTVALLGVIGGTVTTAVGGWFALKKAPSRRAQDGQMLIDTAEDVVAMLRGELHRNTEKIDRLEQREQGLAAEVARLRFRVSALEAEITRLGGDPRQVKT